MQENILAVDLSTEQVLEVNLPEQDNVAQIDVYWQDEVTLDLDLSLMYIVSGQREIQDYVDNKSKPEIDDYIETYAKPIVLEVVEEIATPVVGDYIENVTKPEIKEFADKEMAGYAATATAQVALATEQAVIATTKASEASSSATEAKNSQNAAANSASQSASSATASASSASASANSAALSKQYANDKINQTHITNCITEIPQDIKLELNNGTLTLKAGSKVYVPNGAGKFDELVVSADKSVTQGTNGQYFIFAESNGSSIFTRAVSSVESGATRKLSSNYSIWYDTTNNLIQIYGSSATTSIGTAAFPIAIITVSNGAISSINQVFNGFGYIGSTIFVLPGVKGLIPNGRNADGSLKNTEFTTTKVSLNTKNWVITPYVLRLNVDGTITYVQARDVYIQDNQPSAPDSSWGLWLNLNDNIVYQDQDSSKWIPVKTMICGTMSINSDHSIAGIETKLPFRAADGNECANLDSNNLFKGINSFSEEIKFPRVTSTSSAKYDDFLSVILDKPRTSINQVQSYTLALKDSDNQYFSWLALNVDNVGNTKTTLGARAYDTSGAKVGEGSLSVTAKRDGTFVTHTTTPPASDNSTQIATTAWVNTFCKITNRIVTQTYISGKSWYRVYSDGWVEQGGVYSSGSNTANRTVNLLKKMADTNYSIQVSLYGNINDRVIRATPSNVSAFICQVRNSGTTAPVDSNGDFCWMVCGKGA